MIPVTTPTIRKGGSIGPHSGFSGSSRALRPFWMYRLIVASSAVDVGTVERAIARKPSAYGPDAPQPRWGDQGERVSLGSGARIPAGSPGHLGRGLNGIVGRPYCDQAA